MDLDPEEIRVLGCLIEKELTTPQAYPLTLNSLRLACNQSTNRDPVVSYDDHVVEAALGRLRERSLTRVVHNPSNRVPKYRHVIGEAWGLDRAEQSVLAVLALRGPQTLGELKVRTERMSSFSDLAEVEDVLSRLASRPEPLAARLERRPGQKDARYIALLGASDEQSRPSPPPPVPSTPMGPATTSVERSAQGPSGPGAPAAGTDPTDSTELERLRTEVAQLRSDLDELRAAFEALRSEHG